MRKNYRKKKFNRKRKSTYKMFFLILVGMTLGFAAINTTLQLIGTLNISKTTWNIHWDNPTKTGGVEATTEVKLKDGDNTTVEYQVDLKNPGDYYEFTVDAKNEGTIDGMITGISNKVYENNVEITKPDYLDFTVTYADDKVIANNHLLAAGKSESYKVKVSYKTGLSADQLPTTTRNLKFTFQVTYMQADENATTTCGNTVSFAEDSWETIACNVRKGNISKYHVGDTKIINMDIDHNSTEEQYTVRIANTSTPTECSEEGFSQSACGFVVEFTNIITTHIMNESKNNGSWNNSSMRTYLNTELYSTLSIELRNSIILTKTITGYGVEESNNYTSFDNIYLLSPREIYNYTGFEDTAQDKSRQLDYYKHNNVTTSNYSQVVKKYNGENYWWWLRTPGAGTAYSFMYVENSGARGGGNVEHPSTAMGVSPAFRIG